MTFKQNFSKIHTNFSDSLSIILIILKAKLLENSKQYFKNLEKLCLVSNEKSTINSYVWKILVENKPLFCEKDFKKLKTNRNSHLGVYDLALIMIKTFIYLASVNLKGISIHFP